MMTQKTTKAKWYIELCDNLTTLAHKLHLDEDTLSEVKVFVLEVARNQYLAGNRSGIRWARSQMESSART